MHSRRDFLKLTGLALGALQAICIDSLSREFRDPQTNGRLPVLCPAGVTALYTWNDQHEIRGLGGEVVAIAIYGTHFEFDTTDRDIDPGFYRIELLGDIEFQGVVTEIRTCGLNPRVMVAGKIITGQERFPGSGLLITT